MARKQYLINVHTSTGTTAPSGASLCLGEIAVQHTENAPAIWIKMGAAETSTVYEKFIGETEINNLLDEKQDIIPDLETIRSGSTLGSTSVQPSELLFESGEGSQSVQQKGTGAVANGQGAVAFGRETRANGNYSHAEGSNTQVTGTQAHTEGNYSIATGDASHAEGWSTQTINPGEHAEGKFNKSHYGQTTSSKTISSIGIGEDAQHRKNAVEIMQNGDAYLYGVGGYDGTNPTSASTVKQVIDGKQPTIDANHKLDYSLLDNTPTIPVAQVQSDWDETDISSKAYIQNKPTIPSAPVNMTGATASAAGSAGYAPAPAAGDNEKFLRGDGTWQNVSVPQEIMNLIYAGL